MPSLQLVFVTARTDGGGGGAFSDRWLSITPCPRVERRTGGILGRGGGRLRADEQRRGSQRSAGEETTDSCVRVIDRRLEFRRSLTTARLTAKMGTRSGYIWFGRLECESSSVCCPNEQGGFSESAGPRGAVPFERLAIAGSG